MREPEMEQIGEFITRALAAPEDGRVLGMIHAEVEALCRKFPLYPEQLA
jgi:glycine/serine hydroxymethyltransferase